MAPRKGGEPGQPRPARGRPVCAHGPPREPGPRRRARPGQGRRQNGRRRVRRHERARDGRRRVCRQRPVQQHRGAFRRFLLLPTGCMRAALCELLVPPDLVGRVALTQHRLLASLSRARRRSSSSSASRRRSSSTRTRRSTTILASSTRSCSAAASSSRRARRVRRLARLRTALLVERLCRGSKLGELSTSRRPTDVLPYRAQASSPRVTSSRT